MTASSRHLAITLLVAALAFTPHPSRANEMLPVRLDEGFASPDGRFAAIRAALDGASGEGVLLFDLERKTWRPVTHRIVMSATSPDRSHIAFVTWWGIGMASLGPPTVGIVLTRTWMGGSVAGIWDICWRNDSTLRVLDAELFEIDVTTGSRGDKLQEFYAEWGSVRLGPDCTPIVSSPGQRRGLDPERPIVLDNARLLGWSGEGRLILQRAPGESYWLVDPNVDGGDVRIVSEHPGAVFDPNLELRRRSCRQGFYEEIWLHDGRPGHRSRLVIPSADSPPWPLDPPGEPLPDSACPTGWIWTPMDVPGRRDVE